MVFFFLTENGVSYNEAMKIEFHFCITLIYEKIVVYSVL